MARVIRSNKARQDLVDILTNARRDSIRAADRLADAIKTRCRLLAQQPMIGRDRSDLAPGLRSVVVDKYLIFYRPTGNGIEVVRVLHGARNIDPSMFQP